MAQHQTSISFRSHRLSNWFAAPRSTITTTKQAEQQQLSDALRRDLDLNVRQRALLAHALRNPEAGYTHESHGNSHQISVPTARADLLGLVDAKLLTLARQGKRMVYRPAKQLELRIRGKKR